MLQVIRKLAREWNGNDCAIAGLTTVIKSRRIKFDWGNRNVNCFNWFCMCLQEFSFNYQKECVLVEKTRSRCFFTNIEVWPPNIYSKIKTSFYKIFSPFASNISKHRNTLQMLQILFHSFSPTYLLNSYNEIIKLIWSQFSAGCENHKALVKRRCPG